MNPSTSGGSGVENPPSKNLVIRNVVSSEADLKKLLEKYGKITSMTMSPRNLAVAQFKELEEATSAKSALQGRLFHGNHLKIDFAKPVSYGVSRSITRRHHTVNFEVVMPLPASESEMNKLHTKLNDIIVGEENILADEIREGGAAKANEQVLSDDDFRTACKNAVTRGNLLIARGTDLLNKATALLVSTDVVSLPGEDTLSLDLASAPAPAPTTAKRSNEDDGQEVGGSSKKKKPA